jgi:hypothetical protein
MWRQVEDQVVVVEQVKLDHLLHRKQMVVMGVTAQPLLYPARL